MSKLNNSELITESREWFRNQYQRMTIVCAGLIILSALLVILNLVQFFLVPGPKYFAQTPDLRITELTPLNEPYVTQEGLNTWIVGVVTKTLSLSFTSWKQKLTETQSDFFSKAFADYINSMKSSGIIDLVEEKKLVMNPSALATPILTNKGLNENGVMSWKMTFPIMVSFESSQGVFITQYLDVTALVERVSVLENTKGVMIRQLILKPTDTAKKTK